MKQKLSPWLIGILLTTLLFAALLLFTPFHYAGSDDVPILRSFMGYEGGVPAHFHLYIHTLFAWLLFGLGSLFPGVAWFSILQLFLLWLSCVVIVKSAVQSAQNQGLSAWTGILAALMFLGVFASFVVCRISYTTTGALVGAAAVAQLLSVDYRKGTDRQILKGMGLSIVLLLCCYCLRQINVLPSLAIWVLGLLAAAQAHFRLRPGLGKGDAAPKRSPKPLLKGMLICALCFGLLAGIRAIEIKVLNLEDFLAWQRARIRLFDYTDFALNTPPEVLQQVGWSPAEFKLVSGWYFMDQNITAQAFDTLYAAQPEASLTFWDKLNRVPKILGWLFTDYPAQWYALLVLLSLVVLSLAAQTLRAKERFWAWLFSLAGTLLGMLLLGYLAFQGRLPQRAALSVLFPMAAFLLCHTFSCLPPSPVKGFMRKGLLLFLCAAILALGGLSMKHTLQTLTVKPNPEEEARASTPADLQEYALENTDKLIILDLSLFWGKELFPDTSQGIPANVMFWGGYPARSPSWMYQLAQYGIDGAAFTARDFLQENVLVAGTDGEPWESLVAYVDEASEGTVDWDFYDEYGYIGFFQLYEE